MSLGGGIAGAVGSLVGGWLGYQGSKRTNQTQRDIAAGNTQNQKEFAQHGVKWRVDDARRAGINPLAALGANLHSFNPVSVGTQNEMAPLAAAASDMGQNIGRAISAGKSKEERTANALKFEHMELQNEFLRTKVQASKAALAKQTAPALPSNSGLPTTLLGAGQGDAYVVERPLERTHSAHGKPWQEAGHVADVGFVKTPSGYAPVPSKDVKEKIEDQIIPELSWAIRNQLMPNITSNPKKLKPSKRLFPSHDPVALCLTGCHSCVSTLHSKSL